MDHPRPWLRYVDAGDLDDDAFDADSLDVTSTAGDKLGDVDGFIIDSATGRPYYVVVEAGGWFRSKHFLLPIGHVRHDASRHTLVADIARDRIERFPGFDKDEFAKLSDEELERIDYSIGAICCPTDAEAGGEHRARDQWKHLATPDWWQSNYYRPDRAGAAGVTAGAELWPAEAGQEKTGAGAAERTKR